MSQKEKKKVENREEGVFYGDEFENDCCDECHDVTFEKTYPAHTAYHACVNLKCKCHSLQKESLITTDQYIKLLDWATSDDTGVSSEGLLRYMLGFEKNKWHFNSPSDRWDRGRCIRMLNIVPEWWDRLDEINDHYWQEQIQLMKAERETQ